MAVMDFVPTTFHNNAPPGISAAELAKLNGGVVEGITKAEDAQDTASAAGAAAASAQSTADTAASAAADAQSTAANRYLLPIGGMPLSDMKISDLDARYVQINQLRRPLNNMCTVIGDSIINGYDIYSGSGTGPGGIGYQPYLAPTFMRNLCIESHQRIRECGYYSHDQHTLAQVLANVVPLLLAANPRPGACIIEAGAVDAAFNVAFSTSVANFKAIVAVLLAANIVPILFCIPPDEWTSATAGADARVRKWNDFIRRYGALNGFPVLDGWTPCAAPDGTWISGYAISDLVNPSVKGHRAIAVQGLRDGLADWFPPQPNTLTAKATTDLTNIFGSGSLNYGVFSTSSSGIGTGLTQSGTGTPSIVAPSSTDFLAGNWQRFTRSNSQTGSAFLFSSTFASGFSVGDTIAFSARVQTSGISSSQLLCCYVAQSIPGGYASPVGTQTAMYAGIFPSDWSTDIDDGLVYVEFQVLPGTTGLTLALGINNTTGSIVGNPYAQFGEVTLRNLTTEGILV